MDNIDMTLVKTIDNRDVPVEEYRAIFDHICHIHLERDSEFYWKELICYDCKYLNPDQVNTIQSAITFYVGGDNRITFYNDAELGMCFEIINQGYYKNIGAQNNVYTHYPHQ